MKSQDMRRVNTQGDALRMGTGWTPNDLSKPQVLVDSVFGDSHPGSYHWISFQTLRPGDFIHVDVNRPIIPLLICAMVLQWETAA